MNVETYISKLTLEEKAALLQGWTTWTTRKVNRVQIPEIFLSDGPTGLRKQEGAGDRLGLNASVPATCFPTSATVANTWDPALGEAIGACLGAEAAAHDVNVVLGPGLNMKRSPLCGRNFEYYSEDPVVSGAMAAAMTKGIQSMGVAVSLKHFCANNKEINRRNSDSILSARALREIYLKPFEICVKEADPWTIMSSYNLVNGTHASSNRELLTDILRGEWNWGGVVTTDWWTYERQYLELAAGNDIKMGCGMPDHTLEMLKAGKLKRKDLRTSARRVLALMLKLD